MASDDESSSSLIPPEVITDNRNSIWQTFKHHIPRFIITVIVDIILPLVIYFSLQKHITPVYALLVGGTPPFFMVIFKAIVSRTFDALGFLIFTGFIISGVVAIITRNPIVLLLEKSLVSAIVSIIFAITLIPFHCCGHRYQLRPLAYYFYQDLVPINQADVGLPDSLFNNDIQQQESEYQVLIPKPINRKEGGQVYEWIYANCYSLRASCYWVTSIWAIGLLFEFLARLTLILVHLSVNKIVIYGNVILSAITAICILITILCVIKERQKTFILIEQWKQEHLNVQ